MRCVCVTEPRGDHGLEGYQKGEEYHYRVKGDVYRIRPDSDNPNYMESCTKRIFDKYFEEVRDCDYCGDPEDDRGCFQGRASRGAFSDAGEGER